MILGIDEVGRGPWAGPVVVGAVVLGEAEIPGLNDSKKLTKKRRAALSEIIYQQAAAWGLGWVSAAELDEIGISQALRTATRRAVRQVQAMCRQRGVQFDEIIIDGTVNFLSETPLAAFVTTMAKADALFASVSAASIIAKVARDTYMAEQDALYPGYDFASHAGYGTAKHRAAIARQGVCPLHRLSFAPLADYHTTPPPTSDTTAPTTRQIGDVGEQVAADALAAKGHDILARNWRTRWCEIDIVSRRENTLFFTEVKYRKTADFGDGLAAITTAKQQQMHFAADVFLARHPEFADHAAELLAASVSGQPPHLDELIPIDPLHR
ncbi:MAG: ribonuclease HII [Candidatus Saccharibacteria bacterium]|nr:ribonuclease HII [Candidatus Saccharibacteria bacterium]